MSKQHIINISPQVLQMNGREGHELTSRHWRFSAFASKIKYRHSNIEAAMKQNRAIIIYILKPSYRNF
jgi:hypothetical protein